MKPIENQVPQSKGLDQQSLVERLRIRAHIRRNAQGRKSVQVGSNGVDDSQEGKPDRIADLLEQAADRIESFEGMFETAKIGAFSKHSEYDAVVVDFDKYYRMVDLLSDQQEDIQHMQSVIERLHTTNTELLAVLQVAHLALDAIFDEMTVGERYTNAGQYLVDAFPVVCDVIKKHGVNDAR